MFLCIVWTWFRWSKAVQKKAKFLQRLVNRKLNDIITVLKLEYGRLCVYCLSKEPFKNADISKLQYFLEHKLVEETIKLPVLQEQSMQLESELMKILPKKFKKTEVLTVLEDVWLKANRHEVILFGYCKKVAEIKQQIVNIIETNIVMTFKLDSRPAFTVSFLVFF